MATDGMNPSSDQSADGHALRASLVLIAVLTALRLLYLVLLPPPLFGDEAQYWSWSLDPSWGYFSKPPMIAWVIGLTTAVFGDTELGVKIAAPLVHAVTSVLLLLVGRRLFSVRVGAVAGAVFITMPAVSLSSVIISTDPIMMMFLAGALYAVVRALEPDAALIWWAASGAAMGGAMLSKYSAMVFLGSLLAVLLVSGDHRRRVRWSGLAVFGGAALLCLTPNLLWNASHGFVTMRHVGENASIGGFTLHPDRMLEFLASQLGVFGPVSFVVLVGLFLRWRREAADPPLRLMLWLSAPMLAVMTVQGLLSKANANWAALTYVAGSVAVAAVLARGRNRRWLWATLAVNLGLAAFLFGYEPVRLATGWEPRDRRDLMRHVRGWPEVGEVVQALRADHPGTVMLYDYRLVLAENLFYGRVPVHESFNWNPEGVIHHHYDLMTNLDSHLGGDVLFVHRRPEYGHVAAYFDSARELEPIRVRTHPDRDLVLYVTRLNGFRGYHGAGSTGGTADEPDA
jgi:hypothetical protein